MPKITEMSSSQRKDLSGYMYGFFGDDANGVNWEVINELIDMLGKHGFSYGGNIISS